MLETTRTEVVYAVSGRSDAAKVRNFVAKNPGLSPDDHMALAQLAVDFLPKQLHLRAAVLLSGERVADLKASIAKAVA